MEPTMPQIVLISATIADKTNDPLNLQWKGNDSHEYLCYIIAIGNQSIQDGSYLAPIDTLAPKWLYVANHCTICKVKKTHQIPLYMIRMALKPLTKL